MKTTLSAPVAFVRSAGPNDGPGGDVGSADVLDGSDDVDTTVAPASFRMMVRVARPVPGSGGRMGATSLLSFRPHTA